PRPPRRGRRPAARFFFQAEDGIRDFHVTGVQTCALPILASPTKPTGRQTQARDYIHIILSTQPPTTALPPRTLNETDLPGWLPRNEPVKDHMQHSVFLA